MRDFIENSKLNPEGLGALSSAIFRNSELTKLCLSIRLVYYPPLGIGNSNIGNAGIGLLSPALSRIRVLDLCMAKICIMVL